jgi:hypothetical protein
MKASIYISGEEIQVVGYKGTIVEKYITWSLPEGTMYNGMITDRALLLECLTSMKKENPNIFKNGATLIVDGSSILSRRIVSPKLNHKQYMQLSRDDFSDSVENVNEMVCGYYKPEPNAIMACAVNKEQVESYMFTFKEAGIRLESIHVGIEAILRYVKTKPELQTGTVVLNIVDGVTMFSMLFEHGVNVFMTRSRLYGDEKNQIFQQVLENLNGLMNFAQSQKLDDITKSYYMGVDEDDMRLLEALNPHTDIELNALGPDQAKRTLPPSAHLVYVNILARPSINLIVAHKELELIIKGKSFGMVILPYVLVYLLLLSVPTAYLVYHVTTLQGQVDEINAFLKRPDVVEQLAKVDDLTNKLSYYRNFEAQVDNKGVWLRSIPKASSHVLDIIIYGHGPSVTVTRYDFNQTNGTVRINAVCPNAFVSADYVDMLMDSGVALDVAYRGYGSTNDGLFNFSIEVMLASEDDEEGEDDAD